MRAELWISLVSLAGVALGGGLSYLAQASTQRRSERRDERRQAEERAEVRRGERLELLREFIRLAQRAERAAEDADNSPEWTVRAQDTLDELWVCERMMHVLFPAPVHTLARAYLIALDDVLWRRPADISLWDHLRPSKVAFLDRARDEMVV